MFKERRFAVHPDAVKDKNALLFYRSRERISHGFLHELDQLGISQEYRHQKSPPLRAVSLFPVIELDPARDHVIFAVRPQLSGLEVERSVHAVEQKYIPVKIFILG